MLPRYLIRQKCLGGGRRLDKMVKGQKYVTGNTFSPARREAATKELSRELEGVQKGFLNWQYRFWQPLFPRNGQPYYTCRGCCTTVTSQNAMRQHMDEKQCTIKCVEAYEILLRKQLCAVCEKVTKERKWGVPLCGKICAEKWMFNVVQPSLLKVALHECDAKALAAANGEE